MKPIQGAGLGCQPDSDQDDPKTAVNDGDGDDNHTEPARWPATTDRTRPASPPRTRTAHITRKQLIPIRRLCNTTSHVA